MNVAEIRVNDEHQVITSSAAWTGVSYHFNGMIVGVRIRPTTDTTIYDLRIVDKDGFNIYHRKGLRGALVEDTQIPNVGKVTYHIENATADEEFFFNLYHGGN